MAGGGNSYKTPIEDIESLINMKNPSVSKLIDKAPSLLNGFGEKEVKQILKIAKKSDAYKDAIDEADEAFEEYMEMLEDNVGKNYKVKIKIDDKDKLDKDECEEFEDQLKELGEMGLEALEEIDDDSIEEGADELGLSESQLKSAMKQAEKLLKKCEKAKVSAGYELELVISVDGKELDDPEELELSVKVFKVSGRWILNPMSILDQFGGLGMLGMAGMF